MDPRKLAIPAVAGLLAVAGLVAVPQGDDAPPAPPPPVAADPARASPASSVWGTTGRPEIGEVRRRLKSCPKTDAGVDPACLRGSP